MNMVGQSGVTGICSPSLCSPSLASVVPLGTEVGEGGVRSVRSPSSAEWSSKFPAKSRGLSLSLSLYRSPSLPPRECVLHPRSRSNLVLRSLQLGCCPEHRGRQKPETVLRWPRGLLRLLWGAPHGRRLLGLSATDFYSY